MAFDPAPGTWLLGYSPDEASHNITVNTYDTGGDPTLAATDAQVNDLTGDIRLVMLAFAEAFYQAWVSQSPNLPTKLRVNRSVQSNGGNKVTYVYTVRVQVTPPAGVFTILSE